MPTAAPIPPGRSWSVLDTLTADTFGYQSYDLSSQDGEDKVYLGFEYHGTEDRYATIDDVLLAGNKAVHDRLMKADMYIATGNMSAYDNVTLTYDHWIDSEQGVDELVSMYRTSSSTPWQVLANHSGSGKAWTNVEVEVPVNASHIGFRFTSDDANVSEGAYLDNVAMVGIQNLSSVDISVDGGPWDAGIAGTLWEYVWNTTDLDDGLHQLVARVNYSGSYDHTIFSLRTDNTAPAVNQMGSYRATTGDPVRVYISADDLNGIALNAMPKAEYNVTDSDNGTWRIILMVPENAVEMHYRFYLIDTIGNELLTDYAQVEVFDNDLPTFGVDDTLDV